MTKKQSRHGQRLIAGRERERETARKGERGRGEGEIGRRGKGYGNRTFTPAGKCSGSKPSWTPPNGWLGLPPAGARPLATPVAALPVRLPHSMLQSGGDELTTPKKVGAKSTRVPDHKPLARSVKPYGFVFRACTLVTFSSSTVQQSAVEWTPEHRPTPDLGTHASFPGHVHS